MKAADTLSDILAAHRLDPPQLRLSVDGEVIPQYRYAFLGYACGTSISQPA
jgi:hypothetical protein